MKIRPLQTDDQFEIAVNQFLQITLSVDQAHCLGLEGQRARGEFIAWSMILAINFNNSAPPDLIYFLSIPKPAHK